MSEEILKALTIIEEEENRTEEDIEIIRQAKQEIERLNNIINDIKEYVNFLVIFNQTINGKFSETQWGQDILDLIGSDK